MRAGLRIAWLLAVTAAEAFALPVNDVSSPLTLHPASLAAMTDYALAHRPATQAAWAAAQADAAAVNINRAALMPVLTAGADASLHRDGKPGDGDATAGQVVRSLAPALSLNWVLFDFGARAKAVEAARAQALATRLQSDRVLQTVVNEVQQAYFTLLAARQTATAMAATVASAQQSADSARELLRHGIGTLAEVAQAEAALSAARFAQIQARANAASAAGTLNIAAALPVDAVLDLGDADDGRDTAGPPADSVQALLLQARAARPDLAAADALTARARAGIAASRAAALPVLSLGASTSRTFSSPGGSNSGSILTLGVSVPLFDGGLVRASIAQAEATLRQAEAEREQQAAQVDLDVWQSYQQAAVSAAALDSAHRGLDSAQLAEAAARQRYEAGVTTLLEVLSAQAGTAQARLNLAQARYNGLVSLANLAYALGRPIPTDTGRASP
jgi:outer membrane protein